MHIETIPIHAGATVAQLQVYRLQDSAEFQTGRARPALIVCPGGGYLGLSDREAEPIALRFLARGYHAFVLRYSVQTRFPAPMLELAAAIALLRAHALDWHIDPDHIAVCGFSAGGHLAAAAGVFWDRPFIYGPLDLKPEQIKPNALVLCYAVIDIEAISDLPRRLDAAGRRVFDEQDVLRTLLGSPQPSPEQLDEYRLDRHVSPATPPAFVWHTAADTRVPAENSLAFAAALARHQVPYELHIFESGPHGLALADDVTEHQGQFVNPASQVWVDLALKWLKLHFS